MSSFETKLNTLETETQVKISKKIQAGMNAWKTIIDKLSQQEKQIKALEQRLEKLEGGQSK